MLRRTISVRAPSDDIGVLLKIECGIKIYGSDRLEEEEVKGILDHALAIPFSTTFPNKSIQEMMIYGLYSKPLNLHYCVLPTYEWGEKTIATLGSWSVGVMSTVMIARTKERHSFPLEKLVNTSRGQAKMIFSLIVEILPLKGGLNSRPILSSSENMIYPTLTTPEIILKYREAHVRRANKDMLKPISENKLPEKI